MSIKSFSRLIPIAVLFMACNSSKKDNTTPETKPAEKTDNFIPYVALLQKQIALVDSTPLAIYKYTAGSTGKQDTVLIDRAEFHQLAKIFLEPDITTRKEQYTSSSFGDQTTGLVIFAYDTKDSAQEIQRLNLRFKPGTPSRFTSLDMVRKNSGHIQKLFWKSNRFFHIITDLGNGKYTKVEVAWNASAPEPEVEKLDLPQIVK